MFFKEFPLPVEPTFPSKTVSITEYGATENKPITKEINAAITEISENGGGKIVIPSGNWSSGAIVLKSNVELHFEDGAVVTFLTDPNEYLPVVLTTYEGIRCYNYSPLIYACRAENIAITGKGRINGNGSEWWKWAKNLTGRDMLYKDRRPVEERIYGTSELGLRPMCIQFLSCNNVLIDGIYIENSPCWTLNLVWCKNASVKNVTIKNPTVSPNTDGVNIESCNRVTVEDCTVVTTGDDMFCIKAGRNEDAWDVGIPCENVIFRRCRSLGPSISGGIVIGSEMSAGVRNILAEDCDFAFNANCIRIKSKDGRGGTVENVDYRNLHMTKGYRGINISFRYSCEATDDPAEPGKHLPAVRNIYFENIICDSVQSGISIENIPNATIENIHFKDIRMTAEKCVTSDGVRGLYFENVDITEEKGAGGYPG